MVGHIADVERLWNYRILYIARGDAREFSGYDREILSRILPSAIFRYGKPSRIIAPSGSLPLRWLEV